MRFDLSCSRRTWAPLLFACLLVTLSGCSDVADEGDSDHFFDLSARPCDGVWRDSNEACFEANPCAGFACFTVMSHCSSLATRDLGICCLAMGTVLDGTRCA